MIIQKKATPQSQRMKTDQSATLERIKRIAVTAMFANDELLEELVLKGGNAMVLIHKMSARASIDLDFSLQHDFPGGATGLLERVQPELERGFRDAGYQVFDLKVENEPGSLSDELASFWGGYSIEFKLASLDFYSENKDDPQKLSRSAINLGKGSKFQIDISSFEFIEGKQPEDLDGYRIYVYSPLMIACEKLRAICQQLEEYGPIIKRARAGSSRARDFFDLFALIREFKLDLTSPPALTTLREMFSSKHVPIDFLDLIPNQKTLHAASVRSLQDTLAAGVEWKGFDFYFDYVVRLSEEIRTALKAQG